MTTIKRFTPDYKMHAVRFEAFAREAEHGELVQFDAHQQVVSTLEAERDALEIRLRNALTSEQEAIQRAHAANQTADALAVENAALKDVFGSGEAVVNFLSIALRHTKYDCIDLPDVALAFKMSLPETPATDAALAAIEMRAKAEAIEQLAIQLGQLPDDAFDVLSDAAEFETYQEEHHTFVSISNPRAVANAVLSLVKEQSDELREAK
ncbi:hypothetical protein I5Q20_03535 [Serratia marcescens]|nr:hypothetical protein [Serratia marcescens]